MGRAVVGSGEWQLEFLPAPLLSSPAPNPAGLDKNSPVQLPPYPITVQ